MSGVKIVRAIGKTLLYIVLIAALIIALFPIIYTILGSFKSSREFLAGGADILPQTFSFDNYVKAWQKANFARYTWNSVYYSGLSTIGVLFFTSMVGYCFNREEFRFKKIIWTMYTLTLFIAGTTTVYPVFDLCVKMGINKTLNGLVLVSISTTQIMGIFLINGYLKTIPREIDEAAVIDGCSFFQTYYRIILPLLTPILSTVAILTFQGTWNNYMLPLAFTVSNPNLRTLTVGVVSLKFETDGVSAWGIITAGSTIALIPIITVFLFMNKYIIKGVASGAVKG